MNSRRLLLALFTLLFALPLRASEFQDIMPGEELKGWVVEGSKTSKQQGETKPVWTVDGETIRCGGGGFGFLRYDQKVCDFVLQGEYRMSKGCNAGLGIRTVPFTGPAATRPSYSAYEIQILDDAGKKTDKHSSMSLYRYVAATENAVKPAGEWNQIEVECRGPRIRVTLNGKVVQDVDQLQIAEIKDKPLCGYISLQNHGKPIEWRALRLKVLESGDVGE